METQLSREQLNSLDKEILVTLFLNLQEQMQKQTIALDKQTAMIENLTEQVAVLTNNRFGRTTETMKILDNQLSFLDRIFNEAEYSLTEQMIEPDMDEVIVPEHKRKKARENVKVISLDLQRKSSHINSQKKNFMRIFLRAIRSWTMKFTRNWR